MENDADDACLDFAYLGYTGITGAAEFLDFVYPRFHTPLTGFWGGADVSDTWKVEVPDVAQFTEWIDDLHQSGISSFTLTNPALSEDTYCADYNALASTYWGGGIIDGEHYAPITLIESDSTATSPSYVPDGAPLRAQPGLNDDCLDRDDQPVAGQQSIAMDTLEYCLPPAVEGEEGTSYQADWIANANFFAVPSGRGLDGDVPVEVVLDVADAGISDVSLVRPEPAIFRGTEGFAVASGTEAQQTLWGGTALDACFDDDADGNTTLDETALRWEWEPSSYTPEELLALVQSKNPDGVVKDVQIKVRASLVYGAFSWLSLESNAMRASIEVDDSAGAIDLPVSVLYQFPSITASWGNDSFGRYRWGNYDVVNYGLIIFTMDRVVEYRIASKLGGDVVFAYINSDLGFTGWSHPMDAGDCGDCLDGDGDGWADADDPDCITGDAEVGVSDVGCNDGLDNDDDNKVDREDSDCVTADAEESNCSDGRDNDRDGLIDAEDCECLAGKPELGEDDPDAACCNGADDDADGWVDQEDPDCGTAGAEVGFGTTACNNGLDDDGNGDIDFADPYCWDRDALEDTEAPSLRGDCDDAADNDADGYTDGNDPDCDYRASNIEDVTFRDPAEYPATATCYDGLDNDADGNTDAIDPDCVNADGVPSGFAAEAP